MSPNIITLLLFFYTNNCTRIFVGQVA